MEVKILLLLSMIDPFCCQISKLRGRVRAINNFVAVVCGVSSVELEGIVLIEIRLGSIDRIIGLADVLLKFNHLGRKLGVVFHSLNEHWERRGGGVVVVVLVIGLVGGKFFT